MNTHLLIALTGPHHFTKR